MRILMLEDDTAIRETLKDYICAENRHRCDCVTNTEEAIAFISGSCRYALIMADLMIHGKPCIDFLRMCCELQPQAKLCVMSAWRGADKTAEELGVNCFIPKPFDVEKIDEILSD